MNNMKKIRELSEQYALRQIELRRQIHTHPELGGQEFETGALIENELRSMGVEVRRGYAKTGLVGLIHGKKGSGNTILIRADMDALPMVDLLDCPYHSQNDGIAHTCGHDTHTATLLGAAYILSHLQDEFFGTVKFCFQPAEEASDGGAEAMVCDGVLEDPKVDFAIGMHVSPAKPVGYAAIEPGPITAYPDFFSITFRGKGGHGSCPSKANDPILPLVATYQMIQNIQKRISPLEPAVIQVCSLQAGTAEAVIPDEAKALGSGGLFGLGLGKSIQKNLYLPEPQNDFIIAIIGEELGFIGVLLLMAAYLVLIWRCVHICINAPDRFSMLLASGITAMLAIQVILNIAVVTSSMPPTGIILPFVSYGGNALLIFTGAMGIMLNISHHSAK